MGKELLSEMNKIVFFVYDPSPRIDRRISEFISRGYEVEVYGFANEVNIQYCTNTMYTYNKLANMFSGMPYKERLRNIKSICSIIRKFDKKKTVFYFFTLNVAISILFCRNIKYVYEESDMLFDRCKINILRKAIIGLNKHIIKKSALTVFTSEGFKEFYFGLKEKVNICIVPNRISESVLTLPIPPQRMVNINKLRIGFVGNIRYRTILNVSQVVIAKFPEYEFHYYGNTEGLNESQLQELKNQNGIFFHGHFNNPADLPEIYSSLDFVVCTYDVKGINPRYAEPNKLYEALFFDTPMIVSANSFLSAKVDKLGVGFSIDANDYKDIEDKLKSITLKTYQKYMENLRIIPKKDLISINDHLFERINSL